MSAGADRSGVTPVWGEVTSSVDWCEPNYALSAWVAEPFNTLSSFAMVLVGLYGWYRHRSYPARYRVAYALLALVGVGSVAFHATLKQPTQMLDELPMLYLALVIVFILLDGREPLRIGFIIYGFALTFAAAATRGPVQFYAFHLSFGSLELFALVKTYLLQRTATSAIKRLFAIGIATYIVAIAVWYLDLTRCSVVGAFKLHAVWHVMVSIGFYLLLRVIAAQKVPTEK
jgi:dihydroceramidase